VHSAQSKGAKEENRELDSEKRKEKREHASAEVSSAVGVDKSVFQVKTFSKAGPARERETASARASMQGR
jgi:hypothetical protein